MNDVAPAVGRGLAPPLPPWRTRLRRWWFERMPPSDPWARVAMPIDWRTLTPAAPVDWRTCFSGTSTARVTSVTAICDWLAACHYCPDQVRGDGRDVWTHPVAFEGNRIGDCEDYALWAWRKLGELGYAAEFVVGLFDPPGYTSAVNHAWVHFHDGQQTWLLEGTARRRDAMLLTIAQARAHYLPALAIDFRLESHAFANYFRFRAKLPLLCLRPVAGTVCS